MPSVVQMASLGSLTIGGAVAALNMRRTRARQPAEAKVGWAAAAAGDGQDVAVALVAAGSGLGGLGRWEVVATRGGLVVATWITLLRDLVRHATAGHVRGGCSKGGGGSRVPTSPPTYPPFHDRGSCTLCRSSQRLTQRLTLPPPQHARCWVTGEGWSGFRAYLVLYTHWNLLLLVSPAFLPLQPSLWC